MAAAVWTACTKKLFQKKWGPGESQGFAVFAGVLRGVLEKTCVSWWFFAGVNVVGWWSEHGR